ncbi:pentatricopeptide repeat-containing protein At1g77360, mitochondrial-like [Andrographis paniculata]|uniref:pentatricopeptide repeat-containing protein At1g77360, mitochondrial-like n=1 Tax=Andrographis paniculata TaxID=175694 RepID=UPI0021E8AC89|nr:pentatricopeptide repeat-containing protein At1g77360, mitochondrial-like [Andrographis paniculata]
MRNNRKRSHGEDSSSSSSSKMDHSKKYHHYHRYHSSTASDFEINNHVAPRLNSHPESTNKRSLFVSYTDVPSLPPKLKILCEIIAKNPVVTVESILEDSGIRVSEEDVIEVLKLSYGHPGSAVKFFRWSSFQLNSKHSLYAWNLVVDLLGKNCLFDAMWDTVKSMIKEHLLSIDTFASIFDNYVIANRVQEAILSFEVMDQYGVRKDSAAMNSLIGAICKVEGPQCAYECFKSLKDKIRADGGTYAILLEGLEREGNLSRARLIFSEMLNEIGWDTSNSPAYDSFLCTLLGGAEGIHEVLRLLDMMRSRGCYPGMKFLKFSIEDCVKKSDARSAKVIWDVMVGTGICQPDTGLYKSMISMYCIAKEFDSAERLFDEMVYNGAFPDSETYSLLFHSLIKNRHLKEATPIFKEMVKNEFVPLQEDCNVAVRAYVNAGDPHMATKVWRCMLQNYSSDLDETGNLLVVRLRDMNRVPEAVKCAEDMIERGIKLSSATLSKLKQSLSKVGKAFAYEQLLRKWNNC